ncbi:lymphocyte antigen 75-like [Denticeps clupeoides]|uniref:lymphocyte antigen 75-like n=1 Tax=Denticeps clupeoides TaxID=299321 RepID=UPI0010A35F98|nr:lymphocyte antigen 75-like [Denticeps clupeoides]
MSGAPELEPRPAAECGASWLCSSSPVDRPLLMSAAGNTSSLAQQEAGGNAQQYCRVHYEDLSTIESDQENAEFLKTACDYNQPFFCYQWQMELVVVAENKTWEDALVHCRSFYTDLASLLTAAELTLAKNRSAPAQAARVWTSLRFLAGEWLWVDQGPPGARADPGDVPLPPCPARTDRCGARNLAAGVWESRDCQERLSFICYRNI